MYLQSVSFFVVENVWCGLNFFGGRGEGEGMCGYYKEKILTKIFATKKRGRKGSDSELQAKVNNCMT